MSNELVKTHDRLVVENLNVSGMARNRRLARAISDAGWAEFARLLRYKQEWRRGTVVTADRWYPSSKLCAACGAINVGPSPIGFSYAIAVIRTIEIEMPQ
jgi:putative transposase